MKKYVFVAALIACAVSLISMSSAQDMSKKIMPSGQAVFSPAIERTPEQMDQFDATALRPVNGEREAHIQPTMDEAAYMQLKRQAELAPMSMKPSGGSLAPLASVSTKFPGATECDGPGGCWIPPDVAGSIGKSQFVSVSNDVFEVRSRAGGLLKVNSLNGLFGYATEAMFDPRVQYDEEFQRWVIIADAFPESATVQWLGVAVSQTSSATGKWWIYFTNTLAFSGTGNFYDYPMLGISQDALVITANIFVNGGGYVTTNAYALAKAHLYNGYGWSVPVFSGLFGTLAPAHQLLTDQNGEAWLAAAPPGSSNVYMYAMGFPANPGQTYLHGPYTVSGVPAWSVPPGASQPSACAGTEKLDSLDGRFQNIGTQAGDLYYQVHTEALGSFPTPRYYIIKGLLTHAPAVSTTAQVYASGTSFDFNPSIASDPGGHFGINWSVTDPPAGVNASVHFADNNGGNPVNASGINVFTSASCYTGTSTARWGDYSQTSVDPGSSTVASTTTKIFWIDNETIPSANFWSTEIAKMKY